MAELEKYINWTFSEECNIPEDINDRLVKGEEAVVTFKTIRDIAIFTNKRLIVRDALGLRGKKIEIYSLPYISINMWSTENAGTFDVNSEVKLWTRARHVKIRLGTKQDIRKLDDLIASVLL